MKKKPKQSYTIPCSSKFQLDVTELAAREKLNIGEMARMVFFLFSLETIRTWQDPGEPLKHDRKLVQIRTGPNAGKTMLRKPRIQIRLRGQYSAADVRRALDVALELRKRNVFNFKNVTDDSWFMSPIEKQSLTQELTTLKKTVSSLLFTPFQEGVKTRLDALYVFGFPTNSTPSRSTITDRYKGLASIYHPDTAHGSHTHMTQVNQAYQILKDTN